VSTPLLHLATPVEWQGHLDHGYIAPPSLAEVGFVHLSAPEQVAQPANLLFAGRQDLLLLVLDPERIGVEVRWEPGTHGEATDFPHAYGPVPISAVVAVVEYRPGPDGRFATPDLPPAR
jgi:uncharacterized protein (DUF952 family)